MSYNYEIESDAELTEVSKSSNIECYEGLLFYKFNGGVWKSPSIEISNFSHVSKKKVALEHMKLEILNETGIEYSDMEVMKNLQNLKQRLKTKLMCVESEIKDNPSINKIEC